MDEKLDRKKTEEEIVVSSEQIDETSINVQLLKTCAVQKEFSQSIQSVKSYKNHLKQLNSKKLNENVDMKFVESLQAELEKDFRQILDSSDLNSGNFFNSESHFERRRLILDSSKSSSDVIKKKGCNNMNEKLLELENQIKFIEAINEQKKNSIVAESERLINSIEEDCNIVYSK